MSHQGKVLGREFKACSLRIVWHLTSTTGFVCEYSTRWRQGRGFLTTAAVCVVVFVSILKVKRTVIFCCGTYAFGNFIRGFGYIGGSKQEFPVRTKSPPPASTSIGAKANPLRLNRVAIQIIKFFPCSNPPTCNQPTFLTFTRWNNPTGDFFSRKRPISKFVSPLLRKNF